MVDANDKKVINIKIYDKLTELIGREGCRLVGSKIKEIVGSKSHVTKHDQRFRKARDSGMTRLEISFCFDASNNYKFNQPSMKNQFHDNASNLIDRLTSSVLNRPKILTLVYRKLSFFNLIQKLS